MTANPLLNRHGAAGTWEGGGGGRASSFGLGRRGVDGEGGAGGRGDLRKVEKVQRADTDFLAGLRKLLAMGL